MSTYKRKKELKKKRRLKKRREERYNSLHQNALAIYDPPGLARMSEVLLDFVEPYWQAAETEEAMQNVLAMGCVAWNAALATPDEAAILIRETEKSIPPNLRGDYQEIVKMLIERKQLHFADNRRSIFGYALTIDSDGPYVNVYSSLTELRRRGIFSRLMSFLGRCLRFLRPRG